MDRQVCYRRPTDRQRRLLENLDVPKVLAPGCALMLYRPEVAARLHDVLAARFGPTPTLETCCRKPPRVEPGTVVINVCPGCDRRYRELYEGISTVSLWEVLAEDRSLPLPSYGGAEMAVQDACPTRTEARVHDAVRTLLARMDIVAVEPRLTRTHPVCCGDSFFGLVGDREVKEQMARRGAAMPRPEVVVYCVSCIKAMHIGGRRPRYLVDLLFGMDTAPGTVEPAAWHAEVDAYIAEH